MSHTVSFCGGDGARPPGLGHCAVQKFAIAVAVACALFAQESFAQTYPSKSIRFIVPTARGRCVGSRRRGWFCGGDCARPPALWHCILQRLAVAMAVACALFAQESIAQTYPSKSIRFIVPTAPGGGSDLVARMLGQKYTEAWGQQVVVDHRPGAGMTIGIDLTAKATPDGHTIIIVNPSHAINATLMSKLPYDPVRDLAPITVLATQPYAVVVSQSLPVKNIKELIALAKSKPRELSYASSGPGSASHLATEMFIGMTGIEMTHVPYKGTGSVMPDLISGRTPIMINPVLAVITQVQAGRLRAIAVTSMKRAESLPEVPTVAESGVPGYEATSWYTLLVPGKTPAAIVAQLNAETVKALKANDMREMLAKAGSEPVGNTPREAAEFLKTEIARWGKVIKQAGVKIE